MTQSQTKTFAELEDVPSNYKITTKNNGNITYYKVYVLKCLSFLWYKYSYWSEIKLYNNDFELYKYSTLQGALIAIEDHLNAIKYKNSPWKTITPNSKSTKEQL